MQSSQEASTLLRVGRGIGAAGGVGAPAAAPAATQGIAVG